MFKIQGNYLQVLIKIQSYILQTGYYLNSMGHVHPPPLITHMVTYLK